MNVKNLLLICLSSLLIFGCSQVKPIEVITNEQARTHLSLQAPAQVTLRELQWVIITPENAKEVFAELEKRKYDVVLFGLTDDGYEALSMNMILLRRYIVEQKAVLDAYKEYYEQKDKN